MQGRQVESLMKQFQDNISILPVEVNRRKEKDMEKIVKFNGRNYKFRECDSKNLTQEEMQRMADETGKMQYEPNASWLVIRGIGYGWEV